MESPEDLKNAIKTFYKNKGIEINENNIIILPEGNNSIVDATYKDKKFQVKNVPSQAKKAEELLVKGREIKEKNVKSFIKSGVCKKINKTRRMECGYNAEEFKKYFIKEPAKKLKGVSGEGIILLFWASTFTPSFAKEVILEDREIPNILKSLRFKEIYLVSSRENILLYKSKANQEKLF